MNVLPDPIQFEWDKGNQQKNWLKHRVGIQECEETFFDPNKRIFKDALHSGEESRYILLGETFGNRWLFIVFTVRKGKIRIVSARDLNERERKLL